MSAPAHPPLLGAGAAIASDDSAKLWDRQQKALTAACQAGDVSRGLGALVIRVYLDVMREGES